MKPIQEKLKEFENRRPLFDGAEQKKRSHMLERFSTINRFEGITAGPTEQRLFKLLATGKISKSEFLDLCTADAQTH